jgi:hypothetical protein
MFGKDYVKLYSSLSQNTEETSTVDDVEILTQPPLSVREHKYIRADGSGSPKTNLEQQFEVCHKHMGKSFSLVFDLRRDHGICMESHAYHNNVWEESLKKVDFFGYPGIDCDDEDVLYPLPSCEGHWKLSDLNNGMHKIICSLLPHPQTEFKISKAFALCANIDWSEYSRRYKTWAIVSEGNGSRHWIDWNKMQDSAVAALCNVLFLSNDDTKNITSPEPKSVSKPAQRHRRNSFDHSSHNETHVSYHGRKSNGGSFT